MFHLYSVRLTISYILLLLMLQHCSCLFENLAMCVPALLCFVSFSFFSCFCFCVFFFCVFHQVACYLVSLTPSFRFMRHLPDEPTHTHTHTNTDTDTDTDADTSNFGYTMNSQEHRINGNTNGLPPSHPQNVISASFSQRALNILRI